MKDRMVTLAGSQIRHSCHACAFFRGLDEELEIFLPFLQEGIASGDRVFQIVDPAHREDRISWMRAHGQDRADSGSTVCGWDEAYLRPGHFDQDAMLTLIQEVLQEGRKKGFPLTRLWANMEWALTGTPGVHQLLEYETRLNHVLPKYDDVVVCTYDVTRFDAATVVDILRTHPYVVIGGIMHENPFFVPPDAMLAQLSRRAAMAAV